PASHGIAVNSLASTPYNVAVGGTDFSDTYSGTNSTYWNSSNTSSYGSALSYIPEIPWNNSCASQLIAAKHGYSVTYGSAGFCNSSDGTSHFLNIGGGAGGPSGCATGTPSIPDVVSGTCQGYAKPSWQSGLVGNPSDGVRDLPDVSLFAASGFWNHFYLFCLSDSTHGGKPCTGDPSGWSSAGGTSFASPIWAGIQALINQSAGGKQGLPNYRLYQLAASEYGASGSSSCNSSNGNGIGGACIFYDVTLGDNDAPCQADSGTLYNCYLPSGTYGVLSTSNNSYAPAFTATTGWDFSTGIGTVNVFNLVRNWSGPPLTATHDFNGDGYSDIAWRGPTGDVAIWLMNGTQILSTADFGTIPTSWTIVGTSAYHASTGYAELFWRNTNGDVAIWQINGSQILAAPDIGNVPTSWTIAGTGDFSGTGNTDILWRGPNGDVSIWLMNGTQILSGPDLVNVPTSWTIAETGDFNGDGYSDILWRGPNG